MVRRLREMTPAQLNEAAHAARRGVRASSGDRDAVAFDRGTTVSPVTPKPQPVREVVPAPSSREVRKKAKSKAARQVDASSARVARGQGVRIAQLASELGVNARVIQAFLLEQGFVVSVSRCAGPTLHTATRATLCNLRV